jgi:hypothetical protein
MGAIPVPLGSERYESRRIASRVHPLARDAATAAQLWDRSAALVGVLA